MKGPAFSITPRHREQLARWLRAAATSGDGMPTINSIRMRFGCGWHAARRMLEEQVDAGVITMKSGSGGTRPAVQATRQSNVGR